MSAEMGGVVTAGVPGVFGAWREIIASSEPGDGFWFSAAVRSSDTVTIQIGTGRMGHEQPRCEEDIKLGHPQRPRHCLVFTTIPAGTRFSARMKSDDPHATGRVLVGTWTQS